MANVQEESSVNKTEAEVVCEQKIVKSAEPITRFQSYYDSAYGPSAAAVYVPPSANTTGPKIGAASTYYPPSASVGGYPIQSSSLLTPTQGNSGYPISSSSFLPVQGSSLGNYTGVSSYFPAAHDTTGYPMTGISPSTAGISGYPFGNVEPITSGEGYPYPSYQTTSPYPGQLGSSSYPRDRTTPYQMNNFGDNNQFSNLLKSSPFSQEELVAYYQSYLASQQNQQGMEQGNQLPYNQIGQQMMDPMSQQMGLGGPMDQQHQMQPFTTAPASTKGATQPLAAAGGGMPTNRGQQAPRKKKGFCSC